MITLETGDRQILISMLQNVPELATESSRQLMLELAGLKQLAPMIDTSGTTFIATNQIVSYLSSFGRLSYEHEALGLFLNSIKSYVGIESQNQIDKLITKYEMMTPIVSSPRINEWLGKDNSEAILEKIVGENTLRPIAFLAQGLSVAGSVAYVRVRSGSRLWSGTGFMISPDLMMTNNHVIDSENLLSDVILRFNYEENFHGEAQDMDEYRLKLNGLFHTNEELDYTIVQVESEPGNRWGWLQLEPQSIGRDERVNIIQHPNGQPKQISLQNNFVEYVGGHIVHYVTSTKQGSSGSPVFNDAWDVVALHHAGGNVREPTTQRMYFRNEGILVSSILHDIPTEIQELLSRIVQT